MEINWDIIDAEREASTGKVLTISYLVRANEDGVVKHLFDKVTLDEPKTDFVKFEDLDKDTMIKWVKAKLGKNKPKKIEADLIAQIKAIQDAKVAEVNKNGLPWQ